MGFDGDVWHVRSGQDAVGEILIDEADFPWLSGTFVPGPAFASVKELFDRELALAERDGDGHWEKWEEAYGEIRRSVSLSSPDGPVSEFLLHIQGDRAWFRWSAEPFEEDAGR